MLQFGDIFPTPERHTSFRTDNLPHVLEVIVHIALRRETNVSTTTGVQNEFGHNDRTNGMESRSITAYEGQDGWRL
jgi:hypothetical protein